MDARSLEITLDLRLLGHVQRCTCRTWEVTNVFCFVSFSEPLGLRFHMYSQ